MTLLQVIVGYLATAIIVGSILMITRRNPVHSVLWMLFVFVHVAFVYVVLNAEFLAAVQIIIYAGAVLVLFLFVLMLLHVRISAKERRFQRQWPVGLALTTVYTILILVLIREAGASTDRGAYSIELVQQQGAVYTLGKALYSEYLLPFEIASLILLVAIVGAVLVAMKRRQ